MRSHSQPMTSRATMVIATDAMMVLPIWALVSSRSSRTTAISGAMPNQPKKHRKKANQVRWNVRICGVARLNSLMLVALPLSKADISSSPLSDSLLLIIPAPTRHSGFRRNPECRPAKVPRFPLSRE